MVSQLVILQHLHDQKRVALIRRHHDKGAQDVVAYSLRYSLAHSLLQASAKAFKMRQLS
jgi:hypothetical protein